MKALSTLSAMGRAILMPHAAMNELKPTKPVKKPSGQNRRNIRQKELDRRADKYDFTETDYIVSNTESSIRQSILESCQS